MLVRTVAGRVGFGRWMRHHHACAAASGTVLLRGRESAGQSLPRTLVGAEESPGSIGQGAR
jgi:hypothetical protein